MQTIKELIRQRRSQMLVHSYIYYWYNDNLVSDDTWQKWADELATIQRQHPEECKIDFYDTVFSDWTGATGSHLPKDDWVVNKAMNICRTHYLYQTKDILHD